MFNRARNLILAILAALSLTLQAGYAAQSPLSTSTNEGVISFDSDITVNVDSTILVRESITVLAKDGMIKNEVCRDIPTVYADRFGNSYTIHLEVGSVNRDDQPVDFHLERIPNGLRVCMGNRKDTLSPGEHTYELTYIVNRVLGFFSDYDELYWNVTGNAWKVPIQSTTAKVHLPKGISMIAILLDGYTGRPGSVANDFTAVADAESTASFRTTRQLEPSEGMTVVVRWPNGFVHRPTEAQEHDYFLQDNQSGLIALLGLGVILLYYILVWFVAGRGRSKGEPRPQPDPPNGLSPAALRYIWRQAFDQKAAVVNLVDLAVKKQLAILEDAGGAYILGRVKSRRRVQISLNEGDAQPGEVSADEKLVLEKVFAEGDPVALKPSHHRVIGGAVEGLHQHLRIKLEWMYFVATSRYVVPGLLISLAAVIRSGLVIQGVQAEYLIPSALGISLWSVAFLAVGDIAFGAIKNGLADPYHASTAKKQAVVNGLVFLALFVGEIVGLGILAWTASLEVMFLFVILIAINYFFHWRLRSRTLSSHPMMGQIEGLRLFMVISGDDNDQPCLPGLFEKLLPYALALNVEKIWGEKFAGTLAEMPREEMSDYSPTWYSGPNWHPVTAAAFLTSLGSAFSSAIQWLMTRGGAAASRHASSKPQEK